MTMKLSHNTIQCVFKTMKSGMEILIIQSFLDLDSSKLRRKSEEI